MRRSSFVLLMGLALACCDDEPVYDGLELTQRSAPPVALVITPAQLELVVGVAVEMEATPQSRKERFERDDVLALRAEAPEILGVFEGERRREFVLVGRRRGTTCMRVAIDGHLEECIPVVVRPGGGARVPPPRLARRLTSVARRVRIAARSGQVERVHA